MKRLGVAVLAVIMLFIMLPQRDAQANIYSFRWAKPTVCIEMHASTRYPVKAAVHAWDKSVMHLVYQHDCSGYSQKIKVYSGWYGKSGWAARIASWTISNNFLNSPVIIQINNSYAWNYSWHSKAHLASHEIAHAIGEAHTTKCASVVTISCGYHYAFPTPYDYQEIARLMRLYT
jgi:hypothetical protein